MSNSRHVDRDHPVEVALARVQAELDALRQTPVWSLDAATTEDALLAVTRVGAQVAALEARLAAHADRSGVGEAAGATSAAAWWAHRARLAPAEARRRVRLARALDERHASVAEALASGGLVPDQARVIVEAVDELPESVAVDVRDQARAHLLAEAAHHDAAALRILGRRVLEVVAPEVGEAELARRLEAEEREAARASRLTMSDDGHGRTFGRFTLPTWQADMLRVALQGLASPRRDGGGATPQGLGRALGEYVARYPLDRLPDAGGISATVVVTMSLETLLGGLGAAQLDTRTLISPSLARRLACEAGVIPVVLGGESQVLDVGRRRRFHTGPQRLAMAVRDGGCTTIGCDRPAAWCEAHHEVAWSRGGPTSVEQGRLLCSRHHHLAHHPAYATTHHPGRKVSFVRRE